MKKLVPINAAGGVSKTIVSGCYKFGTASLGRRTRGMCGWSWGRAM